MTDPAPAIRRRSDPYRQVGDALAGMLREHPTVLDAVVVTEIERRIEAGDLVRAQDAFGGNVMLVPVPRYEALRAALTAAADALRDDDPDRALEAVESFATEHPDEPGPAPEDEAAPTKAAAKKAPAKKAAKKTTKKTAKKTAAKKAPAKKKVAAKRNTPSDDGSPVPCSSCSVPVETMEQLLSVARTKPAGEEQVLCRGCLQEWSEAQKAA